jgi:DNA repair protein RecO (recombination protein O)
LIVSTKAIVISALKYQEKSLIVKCYTESDGLKTYFIPNAFTGAKNKTKAAYFQPFTLLEVEAMHKNKGTLEHLKEIKVSYPFQTLHTDIIKTSVVFFLSEVLLHAIKEDGKNPAFFEFVETSIRWLDTHDHIADFHLLFLLRASRYLGFFPAKPEHGKAYFEMVEGLFSSSMGLTCLSLEESLLLSRLILHPQYASETQFKNVERQQLTEILLDYYALHIEGFKKPKSLEVLKTLFR